MSARQYDRVVRCRAHRSRRPTVARAADRPGTSPRELTQTLETPTVGHDATAWFPGLRRRQPPVRDPGRVHPPPARPVQGRHRLRRGPGAHEDRRARHDQRLHPQPHLRGGGPARAPRRSTSASATPRASPTARSSASPMRSIPAFREPAPRARADGRARASTARLMFPTLASLLEERMRDDPELIHAVIHSLNEWMYEEWSFNYEDRIFATPVITLPIVEKAIEELEWAVERGARTVLIRPAPVPAYGGSRSFALRGVRPVLAGGGRQRRAGVDARLRQRLLALPERLDRARRRCCRSGPTRSACSPWASGRSRTPWPPSCATAPSPASPTCGSPRSRTAATGWSPSSTHLEDVHRKMPQAFDEDPVEAFKRNV